MLGPSTDGGYYLLGLKSVHRRLVEDIAWSTEPSLRKRSNVLANSRSTFSSCPNGTMLMTVDALLACTAKFFACAARQPIVRARCPHIILPRPQI